MPFNRNCKEKIATETTFNLIEIYKLLCVVIGNLGTNNMNDAAIKLIALADELEAFIRSVIPKATTVSKYGGKIFTLKPEEKEGQFCGVFIYKAHVQISFSKGAHISDENKLLLGSGKLRRHINFRAIDDVSDNDLRKLLERASRL